MLCISRHTDDTYAQLFGDGRHKFYLEFRCNRPCLKGMDCCAKCAEKSTTTALQYSRKFNHSNINEPIPDNSHIYGGKWYYMNAKKWGSPPSEIIEFALQYQREARGDFIVIQPDYDEELSKAKKQSTKQEMPRAKKVVDTNADGAAITPIKKGRKPKVAITSDPVLSETVEAAVTVEAKPVKRTRKPKVATTENTLESSETAKPIPTSRKRPGPKKKAEPNPYTSIISTNQLVHKESTLPTHLENVMEEFDTDGYEIEYVKLVPFELNGSTYFRESNKNKLYKKIKDKGIGAYVGRYNPDTDTVVSDIPDSDDETE
jgi:hypothetical protein